MAWACLLHHHRFTALGGATSRARWPLPMGGDDVDDAAGDVSSAHFTFQMQDHLLVRMHGVRFSNIRCFFCSRDSPLTGPVFTSVEITFARLSCVTRLNRIAGCRLKRRTWLGLMMSSALAVKLRQLQKPKRRRAGFSASTVGKHLPARARFF